MFDLPQGRIILSKKICTYHLLLQSSHIDNWDASTLTYADDTNSVTVKGVASAELKFGDDGSDRYAALASAGAFAEFTSQKVFEETQMEMLASH